MAASALAPGAPPDPVAKSIDEYGWLEEVFREHYGAVVRWSRALGIAADSAEDVAQQVFMIAQRRRGQLQEAPNIRAWLFGITRRACANFRRGHARDRARRRRADPPTNYPEPEQAAERAEAAALLQTFLGRLAPRYREVFVLVELEGVAASDAGEPLGIESGMVHARLRTARRYMARWIANHQQATRGDR